MKRRTMRIRKETLGFGSEEGKKIRILGSWMGAEEDIKNRKQRARKLWFKVKKQLKNTTLSKRRQAGIFQALKAHCFSTQQHVHGT